MPADEDDLIDAAPCPKCKAPLAVAAADLGYLIECPSCGTQSRARRADAPAGKSPPPAQSGDRADDPPPRRRNWDGDEERESERDREDDRDDRRPRGSDRGRDRRRDMDRHDRDDRRSRFRDDDEYDRPRRPGQGAAVGAAVMNFIFAGLALIEGLCVGIGGSAVLIDGPRGGGRGGPFGSPETAGVVFLGFGVCNLIGVGLMIPAGVGLLQRRDYGRTLGFLSAGLGMIYALAIVVLFLVLMSEGRGAPPAGAVVFFILPVLLWLAYAITNLILLGKVRPQSRN